MAANSCREHQEGKLQAGNGLTPIVGSLISQSSVERQVRECHCAQMDIKECIFFSYYVDKEKSAFYLEARYRE